MIFEVCAVAMAAISVASGAVCSDPSNIIQTEPVLIENTVARNFNGLKLSVKFQLVDNYFFWTHPGLTRPQTTIYNPLVLCYNRSDNDFNMTCQQVLCRGSTYIISSLTLMFPLNADVVFTAYQRNYRQSVKIASIDVIVKSCSITQGLSLEVVSQSSNYNSVGEFKCLHNKYLVFSNKTRLVSNKTKCLATAHWENSNVVQCWAAPSGVFVSGNLTVTEGNNLNLKCEYQWSFPASNGSLFFLNETTTYVKKSGIFTITNVQRTMQNQSVSCQVQSPYVELVDQSSGRSQQRFINVVYRPYATSQQKCTWLIDASAACKISFQANPKAQFRSILFNGSDITDSNDSNYLVRSSSTQQYFALIAEKVNKKFAGVYELVLHSNGFGETKIPFQITVVDQLPFTQMPTTFPTTPSTSFNLSTSITCLSIAVVFSVISIVLLMIYWRERYCLKECIK